MSGLNEVIRPSNRLADWVKQNWPSLEESIVLLRRLGEPTQRLDALKEIISCPASLASAWFEVVSAAERLDAPAQVRSEATKLAHAFNRTINRSEAPRSDRDSLAALVDDLYANQSPDAMKVVVDEAVRTGRLSRSLGVTFINPQHAR